MTMRWLMLKYCYLAVAACVGVQHPPRPPKVIVVKDEPHITQYAGWRMVQ